MKKIITTLTAMTFVLGVAAAGQAQVAKTPEKPAVQSTQSTAGQVAPQEVAKPGEPSAREMVKPDNKSQEPLKGGKATHKAKKESKKAAKTVEKKAAVPVEKPQEAAK